MRSCIIFSFIIKIDVYGLVWYYVQSTIKLFQWILNYNSFIFYVFCYNFAESAFHNSITDITAAYHCILKKGHKNREKKHQLNLQSTFPSWPIEKFTVPIDHTLFHKFHLFEHISASFFFYLKTNTSGIEQIMLMLCMVLSWIMSLFFRFFFFLFFYFYSNQTICWWNLHNFIVIFKIENGVRSIHRQRCRKIIPVAVSNWWLLYSIHARQRRSDIFIFFNNLIFNKNYLKGANVDG